MDEKIIELTKLVENEPVSGISASELEMIISKHSSPWESQLGTLWDRFKIVGLLGLMLVVAVLAAPVLLDQSTNTPTTTPRNEPPEIAQTEDDSTTPDETVKGNASNSAPQRQASSSVESQESLASAISLIDSILAEPIESFELTELE